MVFITLPLAGCRSEEETDWHVDFIEPRLIRTEEGLEVVAGVDLDPSPAMLEALERGVSITFLVALRASSGEIWLPGLDERRRHRFRISYLPLSRHYQLDDLHNATRATYPRLNMLIQALREPRSWSIPLAPDETASLVRARIRLDRTRLPSPMRLPTWFEAQWHLDSDWLRLTPPDDPSDHAVGEANDR
ncbi:MULTISPECIES: DUF4390 domain-containing protein [unclassified Wenzhouxiangella]|uniref:DUF4390 domain-containing protein n=1 Tax=unclassified Wenzhouxiangella TaxID=2613841 RepID=UPI0015F284FA|nr:MULTISPECIES: DUF4390 domain-containing protein [unclassified Wenzhouxiangella]